MCWNDSTRYAEPLLAALPLEALINRYLAHLEAEGIAEPLSQSFTLATVLHDLYELADCRPPAGIRTRLEETP